MLAFSQRNHLDQIKVINTKYYVVSTPCTENKVKIGQTNKYVAFCGRLNYINYSSNTKEHHKLD